MKYFRHFLILIFLVLTPSPVYSMDNNESYTTTSPNLQESYSLSENLFSSTQNEAVNLSNINIVVQGNGLQVIGKSDEYGKYIFGNLDIDTWLEYGKNYSLTAFKYIPSESKYLFGTANISLKNIEDLSDINIKLGWANEDEEKIIESFFPLIGCSLSGSIFSNVENINVSDTNILLIQGNTTQGYTKGDKYGNYYYGRLYNPGEFNDLRYGNYSIIAFKYIPAEEKFLFGTTNTSFKNNAEESNVNISLDWASKDEEKIIENFFYLYEYSISGNLFSDLQNRKL